MKHDFYSLAVKINEKSGKPLFNVYHKDENKTLVKVIDLGRYNSGNKYKIVTDLLETQMDIHAELVTKKVSDYFYKRLKNGEEKVLVDNLEYFGIPDFKEKEVRVTYQPGNYINIKNNGITLQMTRDNPVHSLQVRYLKENSPKVPGVTFSSIIDPSVPKKYLDVTRLFKIRIVKSIPVGDFSNNYADIVHELTNNAYKCIRRELGNIKLKDIISGE